MNKLNDKVSYLRGLVEGMNYTATDNDSKLILRIIDALDDLSEKLDRANERIEELNDYIESVDDDLESLEFGSDGFDDDFDEDDDDEDEDEDDDDDEPDDFEQFGDGSPLADIDDGDDEEIGIYEGCLCPECAGIFSILVNSDEDQQYICPHCGKRVKAVKMNCKNVPVANAFSGEDDE